MGIIPPVCSGPYTLLGTLGLGLGLGTVAGPQGVDQGRVLGVLGTLKENIICLLERWS